VKKRIEKDKETEVGMIAVERTNKERSLLAAAEKTITKIKKTRNQRLSE